MFTNIFLIFSISWIFSFIFAKANGKRIVFNRLSACGLLALAGSADDCGDASGGVVKAYAADCNDLDLDEATFDDEGNIVDIPWATPTTPFVEITPDDDNQAYFNQEAARDDTGKLTVTGTFFGNISNVTHTKYKSAEAFARCCCLVVIHEWANGFATIQGLKVVPSGETFILKTLKNKAKATPNILSDTGENTDRVAITITGNDNRYAAILSPDGGTAGAPVTIADIVA